VQQRLQKIIAAAGVASRRHAEELIESGRVYVNGAAAAIGDKADPETDEIMIDGVLLGQKEEFVYIMLNKPQGYVTTLSDEKGRKDVSALVADCGARVFPVGRLDMYSDGLLLFTNDGELANNLTHPSHGCVKEYKVIVKGSDFSQAARTMAAGVELDGRMTAPAKIDVISASGEKALLLFAIHEGRNRQIRRMCELMGLKVLRLTRISQGGVTLGNLGVGKWRHLSREEVERLKSASI